MKGQPGIDYAWSRPDHSEVARLGYRFVMRYISHDPRKDLTIQERDELWAHGLQVGLVFEASAGRALAGYSAGVTDARGADQRTAELGLPVPVYFAVDFDATDEQKPTIAAYIRGAASVLGGDRVGVYGGFYVVRYLAEEHPDSPCSWFWQTLAWSGGNVHPAAHIYQHQIDTQVAGAAVDLNRAMQDEIGVYQPPSGPRTPAGVLRARRGYWSWVQWRLGEQDWKGWGYANLKVRPNVPRWIGHDRGTGAWWSDLRAFLRARK